MIMLYFINTTFFFDQLILNPGTNKIQYHAIFCNVLYIYVLMEILNATILYGFRTIYVRKRTAHLRGVTSNQLSAGDRTYKGNHCLKGYN